MSKPSVQKTRPAGADDFRAIVGITRMIENRLHASGILTFAQLAEADQEALAAVLSAGTGVTARRTVRPEWLEEARRRASPEAATLSVPHPELTNEGFVVDVFLDGERQVQLTQVLHVKSDVGESWYGWDVERLLAFLARNLKQVARSKAAPPPDLAGLQRIEILSATGKRPASVVGLDEALVARLVLGQRALGSAPVAYRAEVMVRSPQGPRMLWAEKKGEVDSASETIDVPLPAGRIGAGLYVFRGALTLQLPGGDYSSSLPGGILRLMPSGAG